jgi:hypothetical protein
MVPALRWPKPGWTRSLADSSAAAPEECQDPPSIDRGAVHFGIEAQVAKFLCDNLQMCRTSGSTANDRPQRVELRPSANRPVAAQDRPLAGGMTSRREA